MKRRIPVVVGIALALVCTSGTDRFLPAPSEWSGIQPAHALLAVEMPRELPPHPFLAGRQFLAAGKGCEAEAMFRQALDSAPLLAPYLKTWLAEAKLRQRDTEAAAQLFLEVAAVPDRAVARRALAKAADCFFAARLYPRAAAAYLELARRTEDADQSQAEIGLARCLAEAGDSLAAVRVLQRVAGRRGSPLPRATAAAEWLALEEPDPATRLRLADLLFDAGDFLKAAPQYEKALAAGAGRNRAELVFQLGRSYERADDFRTAIGVFKRLLAEHSGFKTPLVLYRIGLCHQRVGEDAEAEKHFNRSLEISPRSPVADDIVYRLAVRRDQKDKRAEAFGYYRQLLRQFPRSSWADEAAWKTGLGLLEDGQADEAAEAFRFALRRYPRSDYAPAMGYWRGRILEKQGRADQAREQYAALLKTAGDVYYRSRAAAAFRRLGGRFSVEDVAVVVRRAESGDLLTALGELRAIRDAATGEAASRAAQACATLLQRLGYWNDLARFSTAPLDTAALFFDLALEAERPVLAEIAALLEIGDYEHAAAELVAVKLDAGARPERRLAMVRLLAEGGYYRRAMREIESLVRSLGGPPDAALMPPLVARLWFPPYFEPLAKAEAGKYGLDYRLVLAIIREESRFQPDVASWAGAQGLMQIMPATGAATAKRMGLAPYRREMLLKPEINIALGTFYFHGLLEQYEGKQYLALAGYNAGPGNTNSWLRQNPGVEEDFFVEKISFRETRNYVKRVLATYWTYRQLDGDPPLL